MLSSIDDDVLLLVCAEGYYILAQLCTSNSTRAIDIGYLVWQSSYWIHRVTRVVYFVNDVAVIADSTCCVPREIIDRYGISLVPLQIHYEGKTYRDGVDISPAEVYAIMKQKKKLPTTSTPSIGEFLNAFNRASEQAKSVLCITLTSLQSKTYETAVLARDMARETLASTKIEVLDSRAAASALGFVVAAAGKAAAAGMGLEKVIETAKETMGKVHLLAMLDTLYFLARTGRLARAAAWGGALLDIKPILGHEPSVGETVPVARPRTREKAIDVMLKMMDKMVDGSPAHVIVQHAGEESAGRQLLERIQTRFNCVEQHLTEFTPVMGVHTGPGLLAIAFYTD